MKKRTQQGGFTLVEVVVSTMVATIGIAGVMGLSSWLMRASAWVDRTREATLLAEATFEELLSTDYETVGSGSDMIGGYSRAWTITTAGNTKLIDVRVDWDGIEGGRRRVELRSLVANPSTPGIHFLASNGSGSSIDTSGGSSGGGDTGEGDTGGGDTGGGDTGGNGNGNGNGNGKGKK